MIKVKRRKKKSDLKKGVRSGTARPHRRNHEKTVLTNCTKLIAFAVPERANMLISIVYIYCGSFDQIFSLKSCQNGKVMPTVIVILIK